MILSKNGVIEIGIIVIEIMALSNRNGISGL